MPAASFALSPIVIVMLTLPCLGGVVLLLLPGRSKHRDSRLVALSVATLEVGLAVQLFSLGPRSGVDHLSALFGALACFVFFMCVCFAWDVMAGEHSHSRFYAFLMFTFAGALGVFLSSNLLWLYVSFEIMSLSSFVLVVHRQTKQSSWAGHLYLYLGLFGGLCLLAVCALTYWSTGDVSFLPKASEIAKQIDPRILVVLGITGFGIKSGLVPLHFWLPRAYAVSPAPAIVLSSGILIKTGMYGLIRLLGSVLSGGEASRFAGWLLGTLAIVTILTGAIGAVLQTRLLSLLAWSSISQSGYILLGVASALLVPAYAPLAFGAALYHIVNHALFKVSLVMVAALHEREYSLRKMPLGVAALAAGVAGLSALPLFGGFASKTLLHHAIEKVPKHIPSFGSTLLVWLFSLAGIGTACYAARALLIGWSAGRGATDVRGLSLTRIALIALPAALLVLGLFPGHVVLGVFAPATAALVPGQQIGVLTSEHVYESVNLMSLLPLIGAGAAFQAILWRRKYACPSSPVCLDTLVGGTVSCMEATLCCVRTIDSQVNRTYLGVVGFLRRVLVTVGWLDSAVAEGYNRSAQMVTLALEGERRFDQLLDSGFSALGDSARKMTSGLGAVDQMTDKAYSHSIDASANFTRGLSSVDNALKIGYEHADEHSLTGQNGRPVVRPWSGWHWSSANLNTALVLVILVLTILLLSLVVPLIL